MWETLDVGCWIWKMSQHTHTHTYRGFLGCLEILSDLIKNIQPIIYLYGSVYERCPVSCVRLINQHLYFLLCWQCYMSAHYVVLLWSMHGLRNTVFSLHLGVLKPLFLTVGRMKFPFLFISISVEFSAAFTTRSRFPWVRSGCIPPHVVACQSYRVSQVSSYPLLSQNW